ncbi:hypothetical protein FACS1894203_5810 [Bacteroidia bacterium]|nr:hypothetical protein FACS1894203_5810 [Bacteroidia bacterium]
MEFTLEQQIIHRLLLCSSIERNPGLYHGKIGLILFFANYFELAENPVFEDTGDELMEELMEEIHKGLPIGFESGLSGIGWGVEYLIQNSFVKGDSLEVCEEIDKKMMATDPRRITDYTVETGLGGILHYVLAHIKGVMSQHSELPFDKIYLKDLYSAVTNNLRNNEISNDVRLLILKYISFYENKVKLDYSLDLSFVVGDAKIEKEKLNSFPLGLKKGLSGILLKKLIMNRL